MASIKFRRKRRIPWHGLKIHVPQNKLALKLNISFFVMKMRPVCMTWHNIAAILPSLSILFIELMDTHIPISDIIDEPRTNWLLMIQTGMFADPEPPMTLIYSCQPAQDSSGQYYLPQGTSSFSSNVTCRLSVSNCTLSTSFSSCNSL